MGALVTLRRGAAGGNVDRSLTGDVCRGNMRETSALDGTSKVLA